MRNDYTDYIMHSSKGEERKNHKYKAREWVKGKWQYIYDEKLGGKEKKAMDSSKVRYTNAKVKEKVRYEHADKEWRENGGDFKKGSNLANEWSSAWLEKSRAKDEYDKKHNEYSKTAIGKLDQLTSKAKTASTLLGFNKKDDTKKTAEQRKAREEGMAERERQKTETIQNDQIKKANARIRDTNAAKRESGYAKDAAAKSEAERMQHLETRLKDVVRIREKQEKQLESAIDKYTDEYNKALQGKDNDMSSVTGKLKEESLRLAHFKALEAIYQKNVKDASIYGNANSNSYSLPNKDDYLEKLEKEYNKLMR